MSGSARSRSVFEILTLTLIICLTLTSAVGMVGIGAAQENQSTGAPIEQADDRDRDQDQDQGGDLGIDLDEYTRIESTVYDPDEQTLKVDLRNIGERSSQVLLVEIIEPGADRMEFRQLRIQPQETRSITLRGIEDQGGDPAVMAATQRSLEDRRIEWITTGSSWQRSISLPQGVLIGILTMGSMTATLAYRRLTKSGDEPESALDDSGRFSF